MNPCSSPLKARIPHNLGDTFFPFHVRDMGKMYMSRNDGSYRAACCGGQTHKLCGYFVGISSSMDAAAQYHALLPKTGSLF